MKRIRRIIMVLSVVSILMFAGSLNCRVTAKSLELPIMGEILMENMSSLADMHSDVYKLCLDYAGGKLSVSGMTSDIDLKKIEIDSKIEFLSGLSDDIWAKHQAASTHERLAWRISHNCVVQMSRAYFSLMGAAFQIEGMGTDVRFSEKWMRQYEVAILKLDLASVRLDMAGQAWNLLMVQL
ncbi:MAG TPA: hypothetical protein PLY41_07750 [Acetomicrobium sp.]|nr:hypothetical protein [Acetomicrobium sp.]